MVVGFDYDADKTLGIEAVLETEFCLFDLRCPLCRGPGGIHVTYHVSLALKKQKGKTRAAMEVVAHFVG